MLWACVFCLTLSFTISCQFLSFLFDDRNRTQDLVLCLLEKRPATKHPHLLKFFVQTCACCDIKHKFAIAVRFYAYCLWLALLFTECHSCTSQISISSNCTLFKSKILFSTLAFIYLTLIDLFNTVIWKVEFCCVLYSGQEQWNMKVSYRETGTQEMSQSPLLGSDCKGT